MLSLLDIMLQRQVLLEILGTEDDRCLSQCLRASVSLGAILVERKLVRELLSLLLLHKGLLLLGLLLEYESLSQIVPLALYLLPFM